MFSFAKKLVDRFDTKEPSDDSYFKNTLQLNNRGYGLRVLSVEPHSIGQQLGLESWFDYIIRINNHELPMLNPSISNYPYNINDDGTINYGGNATQDQASMVDFNAIHQEIQNISKSSKHLIIDVWNAKGGVMRQLYVPLEASDSSDTEDHQSNSLIPKEFKKIGINLQSQHLNTATYVWRILNTHQESPAFQAQLIPYSDYIIGCDSAFPDDPYGKGLLSQGGESLLSRTVLNYYNYNLEKCQDNFVPITLYVYNHDYDILRPVTVNLTKFWGSGQNKGILGCDVGYGLLHRIPEVIGKFENEKMTDDVLFENKDDYQYNSTPIAPPSENSFTPMASIPPPSMTAPPPKSKKKKHTRPTVDLSSYMNEELEKSKDTDNTTTSDSPVPPPPKAT
ncbi:GRASP65 homolog protein 1 [[Candida] jaroonii]|uniref:GRASP65 homolog protein 1 n=1 Tax=[Candida] jaroonii TaxID=467808 RepID=A0ACA9Y4T0_9ASCO|nr:GRASP65 homolog protein 1 [[Candida] jaroonii]